MPYIILAELYAKEGQVDALKEALTKVSQDVEKHEKGTYQYQVCSGDEDPRKVIVFEEYEDQKAHLAHRDGEAFKAFKSRFSDLTEGELKITKYHCFASVNRKQGAPSGKL